MKSSQKAFTFVELIVVLVIIAILATIGFVSYESYLSTGRDTTRVVQLKGLHQSLGVHTTTSNLPNPSSSISILSSGESISYQGNIDESISALIGFKGEVYDDTYNIYPTYILSENKKDFQLVTYLEDFSTLQGFVPELHAFTDFQLLHATNIGKPLGALHDLDTQTPIHTMDLYSSTGVYDIISGTGSLTVYFSDDSRIESDGTPVLEMIPNRDCQKILESGASRGDGEYVLSPTGSGSLRTYCDMTIDAGGWTFVAYIDENNTVPDIFSSDIGNFRSDREDSDTNDTDSSYSIDATVFNHTEMMIALDEKENISAARNDKLLFLKYDENNGYTYNPIFPCDNEDYANPYLRSGLSGSFYEMGGYSCTSTVVRGDAGPSSQVAYGFQSGQGATWGAYLGGNNSGGHSARIYIR